MLLEVVLIAWFIRLHLRAGRLWLLWMICGLRALMLSLNFAPGTNFYFREITGLQQVPLLGELISRPQGVLQPWAILMLPSLLLIIIFAIDAAHTAAKRSGERRAWVLGGLMTVGFADNSCHHYAQKGNPSTARKNRLRAWIARLTRNCLRKLMFLTAGMRIIVEEP